jgi:hypothetical protein
LLLLIFWVFVFAAFGVLWVCKVVFGDGIWCLVTYLGFWGLTRWSHLGLVFVGFTCFVLALVFMAELGFLGIVAVFRGYN